MLLCHVDGFKYDYKVTLMPRSLRVKNFCAASVARFQCLTSLAGRAFGLFAVRQLEQGAIMFKHKPCKLIMRENMKYLRKQATLGNA